MKGQPIQARTVSPVTQKESENDGVFIDPFFEVADWNHLSLLQEGIPILRHLVRFYPTIDSLTLINTCKKIFLRNPSHER